MCFDGKPDLIDRDPYGINKHIKVRFSDVLAEPDGLHSCDCIWQGSTCCYDFLFVICYGVPVGLCHLLITCEWGLQFGQQAFLHVWVFEPFLKLMALLVYIPSKCFSICTRCLLDPWFEVCAYLFMFFERPPPDVEMALSKGEKSAWVPMRVMYW